MTSLPATFWVKTKTTDCIIWTGAQNNKGYGCYIVDGKSELVHRLAYEDARGPIADGMTIDHLCRTRNCVNVDHLEVVTPAENTRRSHRLRVGGECIRGHVIFSDSDIYERGTGARECNECRRNAKNRVRARDREVEKSPTAVREWAIANGYKLAERGRIPSNIRDAYVATLKEKAA